VQGSWALKKRDELRPLQLLPEHFLSGLVGGVYLEDRFGGVQANHDIAHRGRFLFAAALHGPQLGTWMPLLGFLSGIGFLGELDEVGIDPLNGGMTLACLLGWITTARSPAGKG
jgi:hypothetical protein